MLNFRQINGRTTSVILSDRVDEKMWKMLNCVLLSNVPM